MERTTNILGAFAARRLPDESLFSRAIRGDAVAFSEVYRRYEKRVYGFCLARSLDREAAADATQEVFIRLLNADAGSIEHPRAWLFAVARNVAIDSIRKQTRLRETGELEEDAPAWRAMSAADTADEVTARADADAAFLALRRMKPRYRTALILREMHGQSSADIAEAMGVRSTGAVDTLVSRARDAFGVAYAAVSELPQACRRNVELMYRAGGTGIVPEEKVALQAHLASCERCRCENARANDQKRLAGLLPLLVPAGRAARSLLGRAALSRGSQPGASLAAHVTRFLQAHLHSVGSRIAAGAVVATLVVAPIVAVQAGRHDPTHVNGKVAHVRPAKPTLSPGRISWPGDDPSGAPTGGSLLARMGVRRMARASGTMHRSGAGSMSVRHAGSMGSGMSRIQVSRVSAMPAKSPSPRRTGNSGMSSR